MITVVCPNCKNQIILDEKMTHGFCTYCGEKINIKKMQEKLSENRSTFIDSVLEKVPESPIIAQGFKYIYEGNLFKSHEFFQKLYIDNPNDIYAILGELFSSPDNKSFYYSKLKTLSPTISKEEKILINRSNCKKFAELYCNLDDKDRIAYMLNEHYSSITLDLLTKQTYFNNQIDIVALLISACIPPKDIFYKLLDFAYSVNSLYSSFEAKYLRPDSLAKLITAGLNSNEKLITIKKYKNGDSFVPVSEEKITITDFFSKYFTGLYNSSGEIDTNDNYRYYGHNYYERSITRQNITVTPKSYLDIIKNYKIKIKYKKYKEYSCYMATQLFGSYDCPEVWVLRRFRDKWLYNSKYHLPLLDLYYALSPKIVKLFDKSPTFKNFEKSFLTRLVRLLKSRNYEDSPYTDFI